MTEEKIDDDCLRILRFVLFSAPWQWRQDYVAELERRGLVSIQHGGRWSLTDAGREALYG